jgi:hypothetical protein
MTCVPNATEDCYSGTPQTDGVGDCQPGTRTCNAEGTMWSACEGEVLPTDETCLTPGDEDCNGMSNEAGAGCNCTPGTSSACYGGPQNTENVGLCKGGMQTCEPDGLGFGACAGEVLPAAEVCGNPDDEDCSGFACGQTVFGALYGDSLEQQIDAVATDAAGNIFVTGRFTGTIDLGGQPLITAGNYDTFLAKFSPSGQHLWSKRFGDSTSQTPYSIAVDPSGNVAITGSMVGTVNFGGANIVANTCDLFIAKFDGAGTHLWSKTYTGYNGCENFRSYLAFNPSGDLIVGGHFQYGPINFTVALASAGGTDAFLAKVAGGTGTGIWSKVFGDASSQDIKDVAVDSSGNVVVVGTYGGTVNFGGANLTGNNFFVAKFDTFGSHVWSKGFAGTSVGDPRIGIDTSGNVFIATGFATSMAFGGPLLTAVGGTDLAVAKLSGANGSHLWSKSFGDAASQFAPELAIGPAGEVAVAGRFQGAIDFGLGPHTSADSGAAFDAFLGVLAGGGQPLWSRAFGGIGTQEPYAIAIDASGSVVFGGMNSGTIDFGGQTLTSLAKDAFLAKVAQ